MARQGNILSFDEAKRISKARRPSVSSSSAACQKKSLQKRTVSSRFSDKQREQRPSMRRRSCKEESGRLRLSVAKRDCPETPENSRSRLRSDVQAASCKLSLAGSSRLAVRTHLSEGRAKDNKANSRQEEQVLVDAANSEKTSQADAVRKSRFATFMRNRRKDKAGRAFTKHYGGVENSSHDSQTTESRAAVYKGEMGTMHRRAARMQGGIPSSGLFTRQKIAGNKASFLALPKVAACMMIIVSFFLTCAFLYPAAQQYYQTMRKHDKLQAEYAAIEARNKALQAEVNALGTEAGIADRAREEFGWAPVGEHAVVVYGIDTDENASTFTANIVPGSIDASETWYSPILDFLFGVDSHE